MWTEIAVLLRISDCYSQPMVHLDFFVAGRYRNHRIIFHWTLTENLCFAVSAKDNHYTSDGGHFACQAFIIKQSEQTCYNGTLQQSFFMYWWVGYRQNNRTAASQFINTVKSVLEPSLKFLSYNRVLKKIVLNFELALAQTIWILWTSVSGTC